MKLETPTRSGSTATADAPAPDETRLMTDLEARWPSVNLEEQRKLYARIEALRERLLRGSKHLAGKS